MTDYDVSPMDDSAYLLRCAENEGGRAELAMRGYADEHTAYYFAREAAHWARLYMELTCPE